MDNANARFCRLLCRAFPCHASFCQETFSRAAVFAQKLATAVAIIPYGRSTYQNARPLIQFGQGRAEQSRALYAAIFDFGFLRSGPSFCDVFAGEMHNRVESFTSRGI